MAEEVKKTSGRPKKVEGVAENTTNSNDAVMEMLKQMQSELAKLKEENKALKTHGKVETEETLASDTNADVKIALLGNPALCLSEEAKLKLAKFKIENNSPAARMLNMQRNSGLFGNIAATLYSTEN